MWDLVTRDYSKHLNGPQVFEIVKRYVRNGSIITFHDSIKSEPRMKYAPSPVYRMAVGTRVYV